MEDVYRSSDVSSRSKKLALRLSVMALTAVLRISSLSVDIPLGLVRLLGLRRLLLGLLLLLLLLLVLPNYD